MNEIHPKKGIVLIVTLWVIVILSVVSLAMVRQVNMEVKMVGFQRDIVIVDSLALAGLRQAVIVLREDKLKDSGEQMQQTLFSFGEDDAYMYDGGTELWADYPEVFEEVPFYENNKLFGYYYVDIVDESAKLPVNLASVEMIAHLLELTGVDEDEAATLASAIQDFKDPDITPDTFGSGRRGSRSGGGGRGRDSSDETSFYNSRSSGRDNAMPEVVMKNSNISTLDELLLIPGMTPQILFGTVNPDENRRGRSSRRRRGGNQYLGLVNYMSVYTTSVNLNSVKEEVLESILYPTLGEEAQKMASDWTKYRDGSDGVTYTQDDRVLKTQDNSDLDNVDISRVDGMAEAIQPLPFLTVEANVFEVKAFGEYQGIQKGYRAIVRRHFTPWESLPQFGIDTFRMTDLEQVSMEVMLFEPLYDAKEQLKS